MNPFALLEPPMYKAAREGNLTRFNQLINQPENRANLKQGSGHPCSGFDCMQAAIQSGHVEIVKVLVALPAEVFDFSKYSSYIVRWACVNEKPAIFKVIVETGPIDITKGDEAGCTPLHHASNSGCLQIVNFLLNEGVNAEEKDNVGRTPLAYAAMEGSKEVTRRLLGLDAVNADARDNEGKTPFYWAIYNDHGAVAKILSDTGRIDTSVEGRAKQDQRARPKFDMEFIGY